MKQQNQQQTIGSNAIRKYILHFDINKTIVLQDTENGMNKEQTVQDHLVNMAWGKIDEKNPNQWKVMHNVFTKIQPQPGLITYREFIEQLYQFKTQEEEPDKAEMEKYNEEQQLQNQMNNNLQREARQDAFNNFVKVAGPKLKNDIDRITKHLIGNDENPLLQNFYDGKYFLLPNFFRMMMSMKKAKKEFAVVFRAFGPELDQVVTEFNKFCIGEHPCYNGKNNFPMARFDGSKGTKNFIIAPQDQITLYRFNSELQGMQAAFGTLKRHPIKREKNEINVEEQYQKEIDEEGVLIEKEGGNIQLHIMELLKQSCGIAISDDREYYLQQQKAPEAGKPLLLDQADYSTLQIFFDDEINDEDGGVVIVKDFITNQIIPIKKSLNKYVVKVDTIALIRDPDYFIKAIDVCEKARQEEIERIEKGISDDIPIEQKISEWELLNELSDGDYLRRTVLPLLYPALKLVDSQRPVDPISFISLYMLKNKEKVRLPAPPPQEVIEPTAKEEEEQQKLKQQEEEEQALNEKQKASQPSEIKINEKQQPPVKK